MASMSFQELRAIVSEFGYVKLLELVKDRLITSNSGLCHCLYNSLYRIPAINSRLGYCGLYFINEKGVEVYHVEAYHELFPEWNRETAYQLAGGPANFMKEDWYILGYWWPLDDIGSRLRYINKLIDIYKRREMPYVQHFDPA